MPSQRVCPIVRAAGRAACPFPGSPQCLDQQHLDQTGEHQIAAVILRACLFADEPHERRQPLDAANVNHRRQQRHQQSGVRRVEREVAAKHPDVGRAIGPAMPNLFRGGRLQPGIDMLGCHRFEAGHGESRRRGKQHEIAVLERGRLLSIDRETALALKNGTEARLAECGIADRPEAGATDALGEDCARSQ